MAKPYPHVRDIGSSWQYRFTRRTPEGKRVYLKKSGYKTAELASAACTAAKEEWDRNPDMRGAGKGTYGEYLEQRWLGQIKPDLKPTTLAGYTFFAKRHVIPAIGHVRLEKLTTRHIEDLYRKVREGGRLDGKDGPLSPASFKQLSHVVRSSLDAAVVSGYITRNPAAQIHKPKRARKVKTKEIKHWTAEQVREFSTYMRALTGDDDRNIWTPMFELVLATGLRRNEVLGLQWADVDLDAGTLAVRRGYTTAGHETHLDTTKTDQGRLVDLDEGTVAMLKAHRARQLEVRIANARWWQERDFIFTDKIGSPIHPTTASQTFGRRVSASKLPTVTFHGLRHTHASILLARRVNVKIIAERLGHSDPTLVLKVYGHTIPSMGRDAATQWGDVMTG